MEFRADACGGPLCDKRESHVGTILREHNSVHRITDESNLMRRSAANGEVHETASRSIWCGYAGWDRCARAQVFFDACGIVNVDRVPQ